MRLCSQPTSSQTWRVAYCLKHRVARGCHSPMRPTRTCGFRPVLLRPDKSHWMACGRLLSSCGAAWTDGSDARVRSTLTRKTQPRKLYRLQMASVSLPARLSSASNARHTSSIVFDGAKTHIDNAPMLYPASYWSPAGIAAKVEWNCANVQSWICHLRHRITAFVKLHRGCSALGLSGRGLRFASRQYRYAEWYAASNRYSTRLWTRGKSRSAVTKTGDSWAANGCIRLTGAEWLCGRSAHGRAAFSRPLFRRVNAETPPFRGGVSDTAGEPDDYLLSHG